MKDPYVYLLANTPRGTLYVGVTSDLVKRIWQHREGRIDGFTKRYGLKTLVWYERHGTVMHAIEREKAIKRWRRKWKIELIEAANPDWKDLWDVVTGKRAPDDHRSTMDSRLRGNDEHGFPLARE